MASKDLIRAVESYDNYTKENGLDEDVIRDYYIPAIETAIKGENDIKYGLKLSKRVKDMLNEICLQSTGADIFELDSYCNQNKVEAGILDSYYNILDIEAIYLFDSYMLALEKNREEEDRFYSPKRELLIKHGLIGALQDLEDDKLDILSISMPPGTGKGSTLYSKVLTPTGFVEMRDIKVGSKVISGTGNVCDVTGVFPQGKKDVWEVIFDDGSKCRCSEDHLWTVQTRNDRRRSNIDGAEKYRTIELSQILKNYKVENGKRCNYSVDYVGKIDFEEKELPIQPYLLGVLLGDGGITCKDIRLTTPDAEIVSSVNELLPNNLILKYISQYDYRVVGKNGPVKRKENKLILALEKLGLLGKRSWEKFIPEEYMYSSYEQRLELLRGLMDTDGYASKNYGEYSSSSEKLAKGVQDLAHSLGFYASMRKKKAGYKKNGEYHKCRDSYNVLVQTTKDAPSIFKLDRKRNKYNPKRKRIRRFITDLKYVGKEECQCIYITDPSHLYVTDDYIITHNTTLEKFFASWIIGKRPKDFSLFFSHSDDITRMFYDGVLDITTDEEYRWSEIFPGLQLQKTDAKRQQINFGKAKPFASLQCTSVGSKNAGKVRCNRYLYCDDLIGGIEEALNKNILDKLWRIYGVDSKQRKLNEDVKELHIATRWSVHDVIGRLKELHESDKRARFIVVPDIDPKTEESNFNYKYNGMSKKFFEDQELTMDEISYKCLYKGEPIEREGLLYTEENIRRYKELPDREPDAIIGICDVKNTGTDFMFLPVMYQYGQDFYLEDCVCDDNADYEIQYENLSNIIVNYNMQQCEFESNNGGDRVSYEVNKRVEEKNGRCNITDKFTETNKETRIIVNAAWIKKHVLFKDREKYALKSDYGIMMSWLFRYSTSGKNTHDDVPDGLANFALFVTNKETKRETKIYRGIL